MSGKYQTGNACIAASNRERRIFRGRGGPKDGNIPRPRKRVNKSSPSNEEQIPKYATPIIPINYDETTTDVAIKSTFANFNSTKNDDTNIDYGTHSVNEILSQKLSIHNTKYDVSNNDEQQTNQLLVVGVGEEEKQLKEIKHLKKRIFNIQESIKLSNNALCKPKIWEANCLNAVHNCVGEWRSIVAHYATKGDVDDNDDNYTELRKEISVEIFGLVQMAMQSGPLTGAKPGYFKRCGHEVAGIAHWFLLKTVSGDSITDLVSSKNTYFFSPIFTSKKFLSYSSNFLCIIDLII